MLPSRKTEDSTSWSASSSEEDIDEYCTGDEGEGSEDHDGEALRSSTLPPPPSLIAFAQNCEWVPDPLVSSVLINPLTGVELVRERLPRCYDRHKPHYEDEATSRHVGRSGNELNTATKAERLAMASVDWEALQTHVEAIANR